MGLQFRQSDRIVSIGSNSVSSVDDITTILGMTSAGATIPIVIERSGSILNLKVKTTSAAESPSP